MQKLEGKVSKLSNELTQVRREFSDHAKLTFERLDSAETVLEKVNEFRKRTCRSSRKRAGNVGDGDGDGDGLKKRSRRNASKKKLVEESDENVDGDDGDGLNVRDAPKRKMRRKTKRKSRGGDGDGDDDGDGKAGGDENQDIVEHNIPAKPQKRRLLSKVPNKVHSLCD